MRARPRPALPNPSKPAMKSLSRHFTRTLISGIVALLPIVGLVLGAVWAENSVAESRLAVFLPASPTPTSGRVVLVEEERTEPVPMSVHEALRFLVAAGKLEPDEARAAGWA